MMRLDCKLRLHHMVGLRCVIRKIDCCIWALAQVQWTQPVLESAESWHDITAWHQLFNQVKIVMATFPHLIIMLSALSSDREPDLSDSWTLSQQSSCQVCVRNIASSRVTILISSVLKRKQSITVHISISTVHLHSTPGERMMALLKGTPMVLTRTRISDLLFLGWPGNYSIST